jgi:hypothetical protein
MRRRDRNPEPPSVEMQQVGEESTAVAVFLDAILAQFSNFFLDENDLPILSILIMAGGFFPILKFLWVEYRHATSKLSSTDDKLHFTWSEHIEYRLDYHLSSSKWAKPGLLMSFTFLLIVFGSAAITLVDDVPVSISAWQAWTYVRSRNTR